MINTTKIYLVTNCYGDPNKVYVGKTTGTRKSVHKRRFGSQIMYDYIDEINSIKREDWVPLESFWIEQFRQWGFELMNKNEGGGGSSFQSDEVRLKKSRSMKGKYTRLGAILSEDTKNLMRLAAIGKPKPWLKGRKVHRPFKPIIQYSLGGEFIKKWSSPGAASDMLKIGKSNIRAAARGCQKTAGGYIWKYA